MRVPVPDELLPRRASSAASTSSASAAPACPAIARMMLARGVAVSGSDDADTPALRRAARARRRACHLGYDAEHLGDLGTPATPSWSPPPCARTTPRSLEAVAAGLRVLPRSAALGRGDGRPPGARRRRHPRQDHHHLAAHRGPAGRRRRPDVRRRRGAGRDRHATPTTGSGRPLRRRGRRERRRLPGLPALRRDRHQRRGRPPRQLGHRGGLPRGLRRVRRPGRPRRLPGLRRDDPGAAALAARPPAPGAGS